MTEDTSSTLTDRDVAALTRALAETLYRQEKGVLRHGDVGADLAYAINPWNTAASREFLRLVEEKLNAYRAEMEGLELGWTNK